MIIKYKWTRDLPGVALVITFFTTLFTEKSNFLLELPFHEFSSFEKHHSIFVNICIYCFECPSRFRLQLQREGTYQKKLDVKIFLFSSVVIGRHKDAMVGKAI